MKIYKKENVLEAALKRIRWLFEEFPNVVVNVSGGKDSTVVFHLSLQVAREQDRLPLKVSFIDQEAEWRATIDQIAYHMYHPDVEPYWYQMPIKLFNATSAKEHWLYCWDPAEEHRWMREKDPVSIRENRYGTDRFHELFKKLIDVEYPDTPTASIAGVRGEESPSRNFGLTAYATYKWATWGSADNKKLAHYSFYPIYDWSYTDVWKAIHDNGWPYNRIYDVQYAYGHPVRDMRVSNVHHETAVMHLFYMQEAEPETYERLAARVDGIDMAGKLGSAGFVPKQLPFMFADWREYRDHLLEKLIDREEWRVRFRKTFDRQERDYYHVLGDKLFKVHVNSILANDWEGVKLKNFDDSPGQTLIRRHNRGDYRFG